MHNSQDDYQVSGLATSLLKLNYQNIRGWTFNQDVHRITLVAENPDIILLAETGVPDWNKIWIHPYIPYQRNTKSDDCDNEEGYRYSGAAILVN